MTPAKRIGLNVAATYAKSLVALAAGLFSGRWLLMALGETDYGILGLVGGLSAFVAFVNYTLAAAVERFFAVSIGEGDAADLRRWFSLALLVHVALAAILVGTGLPVGLWMVRRWLAIPPDRIADASVVLAYVACECFVSLATVPYNAMFVARQRLTRLAFWGFLQTLVNVAVLGWMVMHPGRRWLVAYAAALCLVRTVPALAVAVEARARFPACRFGFAAALSRRRFRAFAAFVAGRALGMTGQLLSGQGLAIVVNKYLGVARNAAITVGNSVSYNVTALSVSLTGAFAPAIMNAAGSGDRERARGYALRASTFATLAVLLFAVPLALEMDEVLRLWLVKPPVGAAALCTALLAVAALDKLTEGLWLAVAADGRIRGEQTFEALTLFGAFGLGWAAVACGRDLAAVGVALVAGKAATCAVRLLYGARIAGIAPRRWFRETLFPVAVAGACAAAAGLAPRLLLAPAFMRIVATAAASAAAFGLALGGLSLAGMKGLARSS